MLFIQSVVWVAYRRLRVLWYSLIGKNRLCHGPNALGLKEEWDSVRGLLKARMSPLKIIESDSEGRNKWSTPVGDYWAPAGSNAHFVGMLTQEMLSNVYYLVNEQTIDSSSVVLDCGANVGFFSRLALDKGARLVVAFEPSPETARCLRRNLASEITEGRAVVIEKGLWDSETTLSFSSNLKDNPGAHHVVEGAGGDTEISVTTIDTVVDQLALATVDYIKMDIEGSELRALRGGARTIFTHKPVCSIATEHTEDLFTNTEQVIKAMDSYNYRYICTEVHGYNSPSMGRTLTPFTLLFLDKQGN
jgi:FkbM family methyltransferase